MLTQGQIEIYRQFCKCDNRFSSGFVVELIDEIERLKTMNAAPATSTWPWISIADRPPDREGDYLIYGGYEGQWHAADPIAFIITRWMRASRHDPYQWHFYNKVVGPAYQVTHWCELIPPIIPGPETPSGPPYDPAARPVDPSSPPSRPD